MASNRGPRWWRTVTGFTGWGGMSWLLSMLLDRRPAQPEDLEPQDLADPDCHTITVAGRPVLYHREGEGPPAIVFIHGFGERLQIWRPVQQALAPDYPSVALDLWGFGASERPHDAKPIEWVDEVIGLLDALGAQQAVLVGHSLGGRVSLQTAQRHPDRVSGLVLCDADWGQAPHGYLLVWLMAKLRFIPKLLAPIRSDRRHFERIARLIFTPNFPPTEPLLDTLHRPLRVKGTSACWQSMASAPPLRHVRHLPRGIQCPALVIMGENDPVVPLWTGEKLARQLSGQLEIIKDCGHFPPEEYPEQVMALLRAFLAIPPTP